MLSVCFVLWPIFHSGDDLFRVVHLHSKTRVRDTSPPSSAAILVAANKKSQNINFTLSFLETLRSKGTLDQGFRKYNNRFQVLRNYSASQIDNFVADFGIPNLNSTAFKEQFLVCTGITLAKQFVNVTNEGNVIVPKHFQNCKNMRFQESGKTVALLSFPGSGNSWMRQILETTTGIYTGSYMDCDISYVSNAGMIGEGVYTDNVIAIKTHFINKNLPWFQKHDIIYIVRNPFDAILAEWKRMNSIQHHNRLEAHISTAAIFGKYFSS